MKKTKIAMALCSGVLALIACLPASAGVVSITAGYDAALDNSYVQIDNDTGASFSNVILKSVGDGGTASVSLGTVLSGFSVKYYFAGQAGLHTDYDDFFSGNNQWYSLSGNWLDKKVSAGFSPAVNKTGSFLPFLGNGADGFELDASVNGVVAQFNPVAVPEPGSVALLGLGFAGLAAFRRKKS